MKHNTSAPPRWAEAALISLLRPSDREPISGDLLEEYRAARRPALGSLGANAWYLRHVLTVLWRLIRPCALALAGLILLALAMKDMGDFSQWPSYIKDLIDGGAVGGVLLIYLWAGFRGSRRTRLIRTGTLAAGATSLFGLTAGFAFEAIRAPSLVIVPFSKPFMFVILSVLLSYGAAVGTLGGLAGRWFAQAHLPSSSTGHPV